MASRFILRKENFGGLIFDKNNMGIYSFNKKEFNVVKEKYYDQEFIDFHVKNFSTLNAPLKVFFTLTKFCNLFCRHCLNDSGPKKHESLYFPDMKRWLDEMKSMGVFEIGISGGEPTLHPKFFEIINLIRTYGFIIYLNTNGKYSPDFLNQLATIGINKFKISIDGMKINNDLLRGRGSFEKAINSIKHLKRLNNYVRINYTLTRGNIPDIFDMILLAEQLDCSLKIAPLISVGRGTNVGSNILTIAEGKLIHNEVAEFCKRNRIKTHIEFASDLVTQNCTEVITEYNYTYSTCGIRHVHMSIDSDGLAYSTGKQTDFNKQQLLGSAREKSLEELWKIAMIKNQQFVKLCPDCHYLNIDDLLLNSFSDKKSCYAS